MVDVNWHIFTLSLAVSLVPLVDASNCTLFTTMNTSTGYVKDDSTGIHFFFGVGPAMKSISLSWFVPNSHLSLLNSSSISFSININVEPGIWYSLTTSEVNGSITIPSNTTIHFMGLELTWQGRTSRRYCCNVMECIILPPPELNISAETRDCDSGKCTVTIKGSGMGVPSEYFVNCAIKYWQSTGANPSAIKIECKDYQTSCALPNLFPYRKYQVQMGCLYAFARPHEGRRQWCRPVNFTTPEIAPGTVVNPTDVEVVSGSNRSVLIRWQPPDETYGAVLYYTVALKGSGDCVDHKERYNTTELNFTFNGLAFECRYSVNITASNGAGEGPKQILIIEKNQKTPSEPTFDEVTVTSTTVTLRWSPPKNPFGAIRYNLTRKIDETILGSVNTTSLGPGTLEAVVRNYTFTDLLPYTMYTFLLRVKNHARQSRGVEQTVTTKQAVPSAAPANLMAISRPGHPTDLAVNWSSVPTNQSNGIITSYTLYWWMMFHPNKGCQYETGTNVTKLKQNITDGRQSYLMKGLKSNSTYCVAITASTSAGEGPCTTAFGRTVKGFINVENLSIVDTSADSVFIEWQLSVTANLQEVVSVNIMVDGRVVASHVANHSSYHLEHLVHYTRYNISLQACWLEYQQPDGCGPYSHIIALTKAAKPSAPQNLFVADLENGWVNLSWESPASPNGYISSYRVVYYSDTKREEVTTSLTFQDLHLTCSKFSATKYVFEVYAVNTAEELEGPAVTKRTKVCTKHKVLSLVIAMVIVPCCIITACGLLVWWCIFYPKQKLDIKIVKAISHPKMFASTGRRPEKEVFDTLKAKPKVLESETYMIMKPAMHHNRKFSKDNNSSQEYLKMSMTYISDAT